MVYLIMRREGLAVNHKRVERLYREEGLSLRRRRRRKCLSHLRMVRQAPQAANQRWAGRLFHDAIQGGRRYRALTSRLIVPDFSRSRWTALLGDVSQSQSRGALVVLRLVTLAVVLSGIRFDAAVCSF